MNTETGAISPDRGNHAIKVTRAGLTRPDIQRRVRYSVRYLACAWLGRQVRAICSCTADNNALGCSATGRPGRPGIPSVMSLETHAGTVLKEDIFSDAGVNDSRQSIAELVILARNAQTLPLVAEIESVTCTYIYTLTGILTDGLLNLVRDHQPSFSTILIGNQICRIFVTASPIPGWVTVPRSSGSGRSEATATVAGERERAASADGDQVVGTCVCVSSRGIRRTGSILTYCCICCCFAIAGGGPCKFAGWLFFARNVRVFADGGRCAAGCVAAIGGV